MSLAVASTRASMYGVCNMNDLIHNAEVVPAAQADPPKPTPPPQSGAWPTNTQRFGIATQSNSFRNTTPAALSLPQIASRRRHDGSDGHGVIHGQRGHTWMPKLRWYIWVAQTRRATRQGCAWTNGDRPLE